MGRKKGKNIRIKINGDFSNKVLQPKSMRSIRIFTGYEREGDKNLKQVTGEWTEVRVTPSNYEELLARSIAKYQDTDGNWNMETIKFFDVELLGEPEETTQE